MPTLDDVETQLVQMTLTAKQRRDVAALRAAHTRFEDAANRAEEAADERAMLIRKLTGTDPEEGGRGVLTQTFVASLLGLSRQRITQIVQGTDDTSDTEE